MMCKSCKPYLISNKTKRTHHILKLRKKAFYEKKVFTFFMPATCFKKGPATHFTSDTSSGLLLC